MTYEHAVKEALDAVEETQRFMETVDWDALDPDDPEPWELNQLDWLNEVECRTEDRVTELREEMLDEEEMLLDLLDNPEPKGW